MKMTISIEEVHSANLTSHRLRDVVLGEVHARPFTPMSAPTRILHFAFETSGTKAQADRDKFMELCRRHGSAGPSAGGKHHRALIGQSVLCWEQHSEFTTYSWETPIEFGSEPFSPSPSLFASLMTLVPQPGPLLVAVDLNLVSDPIQVSSLEALFNRSSLAAAENSDRTAYYATDFHVHCDGFIRILVVERGLRPDQAGAMVRRVIEIETYRTLALLGLPEAQRIAPSIDRVEMRLAEVADGMRLPNDLATNRQLLAELTTLAAEVEADAASSAFRFGASRAYDEIVQQRLQTIGENEVGGLSTWSSFLARRMAPAMRTCSRTEARQANLSAKLSRAAVLLRTRVDVELEQQNQDLLKSMNTRTRLQLRLQTTVEGLSVAAISYYVVGLVEHLVKAAHDTGRLAIEPNFITAACVPVVAVTVWCVVQSIRKAHVSTETD